MDSGTNFIFLFDPCLVHLVGHDFNMGAGRGTPILSIVVISDKGVNFM